ncbi:MAG: TlpA family protein disulfide reductase, partial [Holophagales bacterium]|nr:TlpA family protein disulfide reductase [Holophagales bacterium]
DPTDEPPRFQWIRDLAGPAVLFALGLLVVLLAAENRRLEEALRIAAQRSPGGLAVGDTLPDFEVADLDGRAAGSPLAAKRPSLLFFFTTTCSTCDQNLGAWLDLHERYGEAFRVLGIGLDSPAAIREYADRHRMPFEVVVVSDPRTIQGLGLVGVPDTLLVDGEGRVQARHLGVLPEDWDRHWLDA